MATSIRMPGHLDRLPRRYTVETGKSLNDAWDTAADAGLYDLWILGPNGFQRHFIGSTAHEYPAAPPTLELDYEPASTAIELLASNRRGRRSVLMLTDAYAAHACQELRLPRDGRVKEQRSVRASACWYDLTVTSGSFSGWSQRFAGRLETGRHGFSDPLLGG